uniref:Helitron helicase-like domain-containing protein n=1 Tax=Setaria italica TaxID=4555 RepID=K4AIV9_SETIT
MTDQEKQEKLKKRREAYHQQKRTKKQQKIHKKCMHERERYANMQPNQKKAKLEQVSANRARQRDTLSKKSIAMENPANRNENFTARTMEKTPALPDEDCSTNTKVIDDLESLKQPTNMKEDIPYSMCPGSKDGEETNQSFIDDEPYGDDGVVYEEDTDEEDNIISGQAEWEDMEVEIKENESTVPEDSNINDPYDIVYSNIPNNTHMLKPVENCKYCDAKKFHHEPEGLCCRKGQIKLANLETPHQLMRLWTSNDSDAIHFRKNIRFFNGHFSFTSLYCRLDRDTTTMRNSGIYTFRAHGQIYHNIRSFAKDGSDPKHLELYFYDDDPTLEHRYRYCRKEMYEQDKHVLLIITNTLRNNPYSEQFRSLGQEENLEDYRVMLNLDQRLDQRTYNAPITSEVAAVWIEGNERRNTFDRNVILHGNNNKIQGIRSYTGCYDPLSYPLFFPRGELGWHADIPKVGITTEDIESSQLDFIWNHQKEIRADLYQGLLDSIHAGQDRGDAVGKRTVLSSSFIGGPRDKMRRYLDAMALVRKYGKPDIFLTMTCNPNWEEITNELEFGQTPQDRPDLVVRVFRAKLEQMKKQLLEEHILGKLRYYSINGTYRIGRRSR